MFFGDRIIYRRLSQRAALGRLGLGSGGCCWRLVGCYLVLVRWVCAQCCWTSSFSWVELVAVSGRVLLSCWLLEMAVVVLLDVLGVNAVGVDVLL